MPHPCRRARSLSLGPRGGRTPCWHACSPAPDHVPRGGRIPFERARSGTAPRPHEHSERRALVFFAVSCTSPQGSSLSSIQHFTSTSSRTCDVLNIGD